MEKLSPICVPLDLVAAFFEKRPQGRSNLVIILYDINPHESPLSCEYIIKEED
ncbi:hypothetical protein [Qipengyuania aquimaris]|uniref:hypothetical protein n=1 Tax=Qipengyuania aquimaris TaxID=255984 RepID=UPI0021BD2004|nr:hypothetical protein [Qipengyuania aquimaris]